MLRFALLTLVAAGLAGPGSHPATCFGAAAMDPYRTCHTSPRQTSVTPTPSEAARQRNDACFKAARIGLLYVCSFGRHVEQAHATVALVGDSHAAVWRAALRVVAARHGWRGLSITHAGCPFSAAVKRLAGYLRAQCVRWNAEVLAWLGRHPEVSTVLVAQNAGSAGVGVVATPGQSQTEAQVEGYLAAWHALPASVKHLVVIRDTPHMLDSTPQCVAQAIAAQVPAGAACARPRAQALGPDPAMLAAARTAAARVGTVDLDDLMCDASLCYPVVGGALVYRDENHMTVTFARTLGPFLDHALQHSGSSGT